jgi:putative ABC transport system permease protein
MNEFGFDRFHRESETIFRVLQKNMDDEFSGNRLSNNIPENVFSALKINAVDSASLSRVKVMNELSVRGHEKIHQNQEIHAADPAVTNIFTFDFLDGSAIDFSDKATPILLSSSSAIRYFGTIRATGKYLTLYAQSDTLVFTVAAVFKDFPQNSHDGFHCFVRYDAKVISSLGFNETYSGVYGRMKPDKSEYLQRKMDVMIHGQKVAYRFQPITQIYFGPRVIGEDSKHGDRYSILILISITTLIVFLALSNFINLTTLTLPQRARELAIKKLVGTSHLQLIADFTKELFSIVSISLILGIALLAATSDLIEPILGIHIASLLISGKSTTIIILGGMLAMLVTTPLLVTFKFIKATPVRLLSSESITFPRLKRFITVFQFGISIFLIVASMVTTRQIDYSLIKEPGRNHDQVVYMRYPDDLTNEGLYNLRSSWKKNNGNILDVMAISQLPDRVTSKEIGSGFFFMSVDPEFRDFFDLKIIKGNWFKANDGDSIVAVNETGYDAAGGKINNLVGVFEDVNGRFNKPDKPLKVNIVPYFKYNFLCVRILEVDVRRTIRFLSEYFRNGTASPQVYFFDNSFGNWLVYQDRLNSLTKFLSAVSIVLSCVAIYGLSVTIVRDKLKPIAIHKLCGADALHISRMLIRELTTQLLLAVGIFGPLTYLVLKELLRTFVYATPFIWLDPFIPIVYCTFIITVLCGFQALTLNRGALSLALKG